LRIENEKNTKLDMKNEANLNNSQFSILNSQFIRVAIVDDHKIITDALSEIINKTDGIRVVDKAFSIAECREMLTRCQPDVLLLDVSLPDGNGIELCSEIRKNYPDVKILILTSYAESNVIARALDEGAHGYVLKSDTVDKVIQGIRVVAEGKRFLCDQTKVLFKNQIFKPVPLSPKEKEVLKLIVEGFTIKEIAEKLFLGFETVRSYHKYIHLKLDVHTTAQLVKMAIEQKLV
jgi:DNA-binding NarL/FixJ family response regulator